MESILSFWCKVSLNKWTGSLDGFSGLSANYCNLEKSAEVIRFYYVVDLVWFWYSTLWCRNTFFSFYDIMVVNFFWFFLMIFMFPYKGKMFFADFVWPHGPLLKKWNLFNKCVPHVDIAATEPAAMISVCAVKCCVAGLFYSTGSSSN